ncbi:phosphoribosylglycinamide formyltransferase [Edaphobacter acidisoli]|uniref:Phosphoribosylglycinamide formyltransferase n=1 Tax=Edaphobacter acidisoli TaxID=2040573 RepID=A0A916RU91_9BACT|nr:phosphoribosylglycinamide formyltransferase [Edaphobacter acidisoli]GGA69994.1 phosphoribosylglycinamide formyltransferase [Edaphobacter acidisoli]
MKRLGVLLSGRGSNFLAIARAIREQRLPGAEIAVVLSNREDAPGLAAAHKLGLPAFCVPSAGRSRVDHDAEMLARLHQHKVDLVCLAGYMRVITPDFIRAFPDRIVNIHPSLLPAFPGLDAQRQALEYGVKISGCTVHFVDEAVDHGVIILQKTVHVKDDDTVESLSARILEQEHIAYPEAIARVLSGEYTIEDRRFVSHENKALRVTAR